MSEPIYLEQGPRRTFACAADWPGWCRVARGDDTAIATLAAYADRYAIVAHEADVAFPFVNMDPDAIVPQLTVVEKVEGSGGTDFGAPARHPRAGPRAARRRDRAASRRSAGRHLARVRRGRRLRARSPAQGPRGGGRDRDEIVAHVAGSERSYARSIGVRYTPRRFGQSGGQAAMRADVIDVLRAARDGTPGGKGWPARYASRRMAWHVLDHAWEIEDKSN